MASGLVGWWRIEAMEVWDQEAVDLVGPAFIEIGADGIGRLSFIAVVGSIDCRFGVDDGVEAVEFSWDGDEEGTPVSGRGSASLSADGKLVGRVFFHLGDDSWFSARRVDAAELE